jgi:catechol 2,3-dioxygenase-like lactoylglutathione lyase family enzyme
MKLEVAVIPVAEVETAKQFYSKLGWRLDADFTRIDGSRAVQLTPPGSPASIHLGKKSAHYLVVSDVAAARAELAQKGIDVSEVFHLGGEGRVSGPEPERRSYSSLASFSDPDGNQWTLQEVTRRLPGRVDENVTTFTSPTELEAALRRAAAAHGEYERQSNSECDADWPRWYAEFLATEQAG